MANSSTSLMGDQLDFKRSTLTDEAMRAIRKAIMSGRFTNGQQLTESLISEEFNMSRAPVREALQQLVSQGLVTHYRHRGFFIRSFNESDIRDISLLRIAMEKLAISLAIERASDREIDLLDAIVDDMEAAATERGNDVPTASLSDYEFHEKLCLISHHGPIMEVWRTMHDQLAVAILTLMKSFPLPNDAEFIALHRQLVDVIRSRDPVRAQEAIETHILSGIANLGAAPTTNTA